MDDSSFVDRVSKYLINSQWNPLTTQDSAEKRTFLHRQRQHLNSLISDGLIIVKEGHSLYINHQGLIAATEGRLTEEFANPSFEMTLRASRGDKVKAGESPLAERIMEDLGTAPPLKCREWQNTF